jgi:hypothetical protein
MKGVLPMKMMRISSGWTSSVRGNQFAALFSHGWGLMPSNKLFPFGWKLRRSGATSARTRVSAAARYKALVRTTGSPWIPQVTLKPCGLRILVSVILGDAFPQGLPNFVKLPAGGFGFFLRDCSYCSITLNVGPSTQMSYSERLISSCGSISTL